MNAMTTGILLLTLAAAPAKPPAPEPGEAGETALQVRHTPAAEVTAGEKLVLRAEVTPAWRLQALTARWRWRGETDWREAPFEKSAEGTYAALIEVPIGAHRPLEYHLVARDTAGAESRRFASPELPHPVLVYSPQDELEREALLDVYGRRRSRVELEGEHIAGIGASATFRLAWDTVPHVPMSAAAQVTNVPGGPPGVRLLFRADVELTEALSLGAQVGSEARQSIGGGATFGLATSFAW